MAPPSRTFINAKGRLTKVPVDGKGVPIVPISKEDWTAYFLQNPTDDPTLVRDKNGIPKQALSAEDWQLVVGGLSGGGSSLPKTAASSVGRLGAAAKPAESVADKVAKGAASARRASAISAERIRIEKAQNLPDITGKGSKAATTSNKGGILGRLFNSKKKKVVGTAVGLGVAGAAYNYFGTGSNNGDEDAAPNVVNTSPDGRFWDSIKTGEITGGGGTDPRVRALMEQFGITQEMAEKILGEQALNALGMGGGGGKGLTPEEQREQELRNALLERELAQNPNLQVIDDFTTGNKVLLDSQTGEGKIIGKYGFAAIDPQRTFDEQVREFNQQEGRLSLEAKQRYEIGREELSLSRDRFGLEGELGRGTLDLQRQQEGRLTAEGRESARLARQQQALAEQSFQADILRRPSDFLARAFSSRGATSPQSVVTQADLINQLRASQTTPQFAQGGMTQEGRFITGDSKSGKATGHEEMIINPTNAPIMVLNNEQTEQMMAGMPQMGMGRISGYAYGTSSGWDSSLQQQFTSGQIPIHEYEELRSQLSGIYSNGNKSPATGGSGINPYLENRGRARGTAGYITGDGVLHDWAWPTEAERTAFAARNSGAPQYGMAFQQPAGVAPRPPVTQEELIALGKANLPPAARAALYGGGIPDARPVGQLTPGRLQRLTPGELEALSTQLAVEYNTDLPTEFSLLQQRFGPAVTRARGRLVNG